MNTRNFKYIYSGTFDTYENCYKKTKSNFYFSKEYKKKQFKIISIILDCIKKNKPIPPFYKQHSQYLIFLISLINKKNLKILDFGGGWGVGYANLLEVLGQKKLININYDIFDLVDICEIGKNNFKNKLNFNPKIKYINKFDKIGKNYDVIFFGSVIQYLKNPIETLNKICSLNIQYLLFIDLYLTNTKTFFTKQKHYNFEAPHSFINIKEFENVFMKKYDILSKSYSHTVRLNQVGYLNMDNFKKKFRIDGSKNYCLKLK